MKKRNIVIPFRNTCGVEELKMCVRLINKNLQIPYNKIYIIGDDCEFNDYDIPYVENIVIEEQKYNKWLDSSFLVEMYIDNIGEPFILFNDDFFLTDTVTKIPNYYFDTLSNRVLTTYIIDATNKVKPSAYGLNILKFIDDFGDFRNYEVHIPMIVDLPDVMKLAIERCKKHDCPALKRTMYQYILRNKGVKLEHDIKFGEPLKIIQYPFFSLTDIEFKAFRKKLEEIAK